MNEKLFVSYDRLPFGGAPEIKSSDEQKTRKVRRNKRQEDAEQPKTVLIDRLTGKPYGKEGKE